jgi:hypothetical protein
LSSRQGGEIGYSGEGNIQRSASVLEQSAQLLGLCLSPLTAALRPALGRANSLPASELRRAADKRIAPRHAYVRFLAPPGRFGGLSWTGASSSAEHPAKPTRRLAESAALYAVIGRPYMTADGKTANVRVKRVESDAQMIRVYGAHERVTVKRGVA